MDDMYEYEVVQFSIPLGKVPLQSLSDGSERLFGVWCYLFIGGMKNLSRETSQQARIVLTFADKNSLYY